MSESQTTDQAIQADEIWVMGEAKRSGEISGTAFELSAKARELADALQETTGRPHAVKAILLLDSETAEKTDAAALAAYGADEAAIVRGSGLPFDRTACGRILAHLADRQKPAIILAAATAFGRSVMPYAAALLQTGLTADCTELAVEPETGLLLQTRPAIGGNIMATIKTPGHRPQMATVRPRTFRIPAPVSGRPFRATEPELPNDMRRTAVRTLSFQAFAEDGGTLQEKEAVVSGGKGLRKAEGFELLEKLAALLGAGVGASRPVVEMKWIGYPHQVGLSGQVVSPKVYIAAGISGTVQHLAGMQTAGKIVSINRDPDAQIFNISDVAICGDLYEVISLLIEKIERRKGQSS